jgi:hypothetical protein
VSEPDPFWDGPPDPPRGSDCGEDTCSMKPPCDYHEGIGTDPEWDDDEVIGTTEPVQTTTEVTNG